MIINTFFLRVSARCNLDCDYCYVFKHRDMSWQNYPSTMPLETVDVFCKRLKEYILGKDIEDINIVFHGGEPLICGGQTLINFIDFINDSMKEIVQVHFSMQTNGTLLTEKFVQECDKRDVGISLSIDGHQMIHDKHRKYKTGEGSHDNVMKGISILKKYHRVFEGVIGVIDPLFPAGEVLEFFDTNEIENVDLLLPDSTYLDLPVGRNKNPELYKNWLLEAFDLWFSNYQAIHFRTFESILSGVLGEHTALDAFGLGSLDYLTIETDGSYHTSDILKVAYENASFINMYLESNTIDEALSDDKVKKYNYLLKWDNLPNKCKKCVFSNLCGGGSLPHRYSPKNGFDNPTVYCEEMYSLIRHAKDVVENAINEEVCRE